MRPRDEDVPTLGGRPTLPGISIGTEPPLAQHNLIDRALSSFGRPSLEAVQAMQRGETRPDDVAREFVFNGPMGPLGMVRIPNPIRAYHGSPHTFDEFRMERIGRGEGTQAYGHGLYFAESPSVAESYRRTLASYYPAEAEQFMRRHVGNAALTADDISAAQAIASTGGTERHLFNRVPATRRLTAEQRQDIIDSYRAMDRPGRTYEVDLHARPDQFLDWDVPLSRQSESVSQAISPLRAGIADRQRHAVRMGDDTWASLRSRREHFDTPDMRPREFLSAYSRGDFGLRDEGYQGASRLLSDAGIPGIRYFDQGSRAAADGTRNYVVFNPEIIEILRRYGIVAPVSGAMLAGSINEQPPAP